MQYCYFIKHLAEGQYELRFPDFIGAKELFSSEEEAHKEAMNIFLEAVQTRFENKQRVPEPSPVDNCQGTLNVPSTFGELIVQHNMIMEQLCEIQDVNE
ncbi:hypothetical protein [Limnobacter parvus]|uniref:HicB family protein n=1 Tax=Limnobacter parvus TaxID=2939690 RepID=A0ABT1XE65_9BURK|nr:hypothetical protein [Limnobacter parvus]MCR2745572.1 hypothetical protein [Limnobacter parvus]